jgi:Glycosyl transferase family 90
MKLLEGTSILLPTAFFVLFAANWLLGATASDPASIPVELPQFDLDLPRSLRFPAKEQRLKIYMSNWYVPPCENYSEGRSVYANGQTKDGWPETFVSELKDVVNATTFQVQSTIVPDTIFSLDRGTVLDCSVREGDPLYKKRIVFRRNMYMYCLDVANTLLSAMDRATLELGGGEMVAEQNTPPVLLQFGDLKYSHDYGFMRAPHIKKFRIAAQRDQVSTVTSDEHCYDAPRAPLLPDHPLQPIIWKLASRRHYGFLDQVAIKDRPWEEKKNMAVFRGQLTGSRDGYNKTLSDLENCLKLRRCRMVYNHAQSRLVNAKLTDTRKRLPDVLNGVELTAKSVTIRHLLRYKGLIMLEGNDVASGLKWALLSESVVLMPIPKHTSWALEEMLEPWVHYVPLQDDANDVEEKMQWVLDHDAEARRISRAATLWMQDLIYHPDAVDDDRWIQKETIRRYWGHFASASSLDG